MSYPRLHDMTRRCAMSRAGSSRTNTSRSAVKRLAGLSQWGPVISLLSVDLSRQ